MIVEFVFRSVMSAGLQAVCQSTVYTLYVIPNEHHYKLSFVNVYPLNNKEL